MYPEFIAIYAGLAVVFVLLVVVMVLLIQLKKRLDAAPTSRSVFDVQPNRPPMSASAPSGGIVFCKRCAAEFDASEQVCPRCGTPR